jgi:hypothetical protein
MPGTTIRKKSPGNKSCDKRFFCQNLIFIIKTTFKGDATICEYENSCEKISFTC